MSDQQESPDPSEEVKPAEESTDSKPEGQPKKKAVKKAAKKVTKKAAKKTAKKAAKKTVKKAAKKAAKAKKKVAKPSEIESFSELEPDLPGMDDLSQSASDVKMSVSEDDASTVLAEESPQTPAEEDIPAEKREAIKEVVEEQKEVPPPPPPEVPESVVINEFRTRPLSELYEEIERLPVRIPARATKAQLTFTILSCFATHGTRVTGSGVLEMVNENYGMLRDPLKSFRAEFDDLYLPVSLIKEYGLREGHFVEVILRAPKGRDKYLSVDKILKIEGQDPETFQAGAPFDFLTSLFPEERFMLERGKEGGLAVRVVDMIAPLGKGQRGLIVAPPRGGKTILLKQIAQSIQQNHPEAELIVLLLDERPEEVTDFEDMVGHNVFASTFDETSKRHAQVANVVMERARRLVEQKKDVVILLDSLTRLARGYNNASRGGPIGSGGISPKAITECRKFFGAARNVEEGGSLTILATCLVETESRMDDVIFEELKGTGNMEIRLDRILAEQRIYPAIHIPQSGTRNDDRLYHEQELPKVLEIRRHLAALPIGEALEVLLANLSRTETNTELVLKGMR